MEGGELFMLSEVIKDVNQVPQVDCKHYDSMENILERKESFLVYMISIH